MSDPLGHPGRVRRTRSGPADSGTSAAGATAATRPGASPESARHVAPAAAAVTPAPAQQALPLPPCMIDVDDGHAGTGAGVVGAAATATTQTASTDVGVALKDLVCHRNVVGGGGTALTAAPLLPSACINAETVPAGSAGAEEDGGRSAPQQHLRLQVHPQMPSTTPPPISGAAQPDADNTDATAGGTALDCASDPRTVRVYGPSGWVSCQAPEAAVVHAADTGTHRGPPCNETSTGARQPSASANPLQCRFCDHVVSRKDLLQSHERSHGAEQRYWCGFCSFTAAASAGALRIRVCGGLWNAPLRFGRSRSLLLTCARASVREGWQLSCLAALLTRLCVCGSADHALVSSVVRVSPRCRPFVALPVPVDVWDG